MLVHRDTLAPWMGEKIDGKSFPANIGDLWSTDELRSLGLARLKRAQVDAPTKLHRETGTTKELVGDEVIETPTYGLPTRSELENVLKDHGWVLMGRAWWTKSTQDWLAYGDSLKTRGLAILAAFDEGGHDIDVFIGSIDGKGGWPQ